RRCVQPASALRLPGSVGRQPELPADHLRSGAHSSAAHCPRWARGSGPEGPREAGETPGATVPQAPHLDGGLLLIEVENPLVRFAGVTPIDSMSVIFPGGACGLIGPNGAGKTTFFNVLSGF